MSGGPTRAPASNGAEQHLLDDFRDLLGPGDLPDVPGLEVGVLYRTQSGAGGGPAGRHDEIEGFGGDFVDFFSPGPLHQLVVTIGDVTGKGVAAAARAIVAKYVIRAMIAVQRWPLQPGEALRDASNALLAAPREGDEFVTVCIASIDARDGSVALATAGHPAPFVLRGDAVEQPLLFINPALGITDDAELQAMPSDYFDLAPGDALLLYTDGLSDMRDGRGEYYIDVRIEEALEELRGQPAAELLERLLADAVAFAGRPPADDVAMVLVRRRP